MYTAPNTPTRKRKPPRQVARRVKKLAKLQDWYWVKCNGRQHIIALIDGKLVAVDHNIAHEKAIIEMGGPTCECLRAMTSWRAYPFSPFHHRRLHAARHYAHKHALERAKSELSGKFHSELGSDHWQSSVPWENLEMRKLGLAIAQRIRYLLLYRCDYSFIRGLPWRMSLLVGWSYEPDGLCTIYDHEWTEPYASFQIRVKPNWIKRVWDKGLSVIEGQLVLNYDADFECEKVNPSSDLHAGDGVAVIMMDVSEDRIYKPLQSKHVYISDPNKMLALLSVGKSINVMLSHKLPVTTPKYCDGKEYSPMLLKPPCPFVRRTTDDAL